MTRHRTIIFIVGSLGAFAGIPSGVAPASSLLSGYGGPGQGSQAILGSALVNGPSGGGSSSATGSSGASTSSTSAGPPGAAASGSGAPASAGRSSGSHQHGGAAAGSATGSSTARTPGPSRIADVYAAAELNGPAPSAGAFGLSGEDLLLIVLALGLLALIAVLSRRLARTSVAIGARREGAG